MTTSEALSRQSTKAQLPDGTFAVSRDGAEAYVSVSMWPRTVEISRGEGIAALQVTIVGIRGDFALSSRSFDAQRADFVPNSPTRQAAIRSVCAGIPGRFPATLALPGLASPGTLSTPAGTTTRACLPVTYRRGHDPATIRLAGTSISWRFPALGQNPSGTGATSVLARYTGTGNQLLALPPTVRSAQRLNLAWTLLDPGNNMIASESDSVGNNLVIIADSPGSSIASKQTSLKNPYLQVISEGPWAITISTPGT